MTSTTMKILTADSALSMARSFAGAYKLMIPFYLERVHLLTTSTQRHIQLASTRRFLLQAFDRQGDFINVLLSESQATKIIAILYTMLKAMLQRKMISKRVYIGSKYDKNTESFSIGEFTLLFPKSNSSLISKLRLLIHVARWKNMQSGHVIKHGMISDFFGVTPLIEAAASFSATSNLILTNEPAYRAEIESVSDSLLSLKEAVSAMQDFIGDQVSWAKTITQTLTKWAKKIGGIMKSWLLKIIETLCVCFISPKDWKEQMICKIGFIAADLYAEDDPNLQLFIENFKTFSWLLPTPDVIKHSSSVSIDSLKTTFNFVSTVIMLVVSISTSTNSGGLDPASIHKSFVSWSTYLTKGYKSIVDFSSLAVITSEFVSSATEWAYKLFTGKMAATVLNKQRADVEEWVSVVQAAQKTDLTEFFTLQKFPFNGVSTCDLRPNEKKVYDRQIERLYFKGQDLLKQLKPVKAAASALAIVQENLIWLRNTNTAIARNYLERSKGRRSEPVMLVLAGPAGQGKTQCLSYLQRVMFHLQGFQTRAEVDYCMNHEVYYHAGNTHWDGYSNQLIYVRDDAGQKVASASTPDEFYMEVISMINSAPFNVPMAALEDKNKHFTSEFVLCTTNVLLNGVGSVACAPAFTRRINYRLFVEADPDCLNEKGVLDQYLVQQKYGVLRTEEIYRFTFEDPAHGSTHCDTQPKNNCPTVKVGNKTIAVSPRMTFQEVVSILAAQYECNKDSKVESDTAGIDFSAKLTATADYFTKHSAKSTVICPLGTNCVDARCVDVHIADINTVGDAAVVYMRDEDMFEVHDGRAKFNYRAADTDIFGYTTTDDLRRRTMDLFINENTALMPIVDPEVDITEWSIAQMRGYCEEHGCFDTIFYKHQQPVTDRTWQQTIHTAFDDAIHSIKVTCVKWMKSISGVSFKMVMAGLGLMGVLLLGFRFYFNKAPSVVNVEQCSRPPCKRQQERNVARMDQHAITVAKKLRDKESRREIREAIIAKTQSRNAKLAVVVNNVPPMIATQLEAPSNESKLAIGNITNNTYAIMAVTKGDTLNGVGKIVSKIGVGTFVKDRAMITALHVADDMERWFTQGFQILLVNKNKREGTLVRRQDYTQHSLSRITGQPIDQTVLNFCSYLIHMHRDLTRYIQNDRIMEPELAIRGVWRFGFQDYTQNSSSPSVDMVISGGVISSRNVKKLTIEVDGSETVIQEYYRLEPAGAPGDSGAIVVGNEHCPNKLPQIKGIYVGAHYGSSEFGVVLPLSNAVLTSVLDSITGSDNMPVISHPIPDLNPSTAQDSHYRGEFAQIGSLNEPKRNSTETQLVPSLWQGEVSELKTMPAFLKGFVHEGKKVDIMVNGISKYGMPNVYINPDDVETCLEAEIAFLASKSYKKKFDRVFSFKEVIYGILEEKYIGAISSSSSCGSVGRAKYVEKYGPTAKLSNRHFKDMKDMFGDEHTNLQLEADKICSLFPEYERDFLAKMEQGIRINQIWEDTPKDEKRPFAKVLIGKTRLFSCSSDVCYLALMRKYTVGFCAATMEGKIENGMAVGINPYSEDWDSLYAKITQFGCGNIFAGDFGGFDGSHNFQVNSRVMSYVNKHFYPSATEQENKIRIMLWNEIYQSTHVNGKDIYSWFKGQPSGNPLTTILNCIVNNVGMKLVWQDIWRQHGDTGMSTMASFAKYCYHVSYGDDSITAVDTKVLDVFNQITVSRTFPKFGFEYTDELKGDAADMVPYRNVDSINFLKRSFVICPRYGYVGCPILTDTIYEMLQWVRHGEDDVQQALENAQNAVLEASLHNEETFNAFRSKMTAVAARHFGEYPLGFASNYYDTRQRIRYGSDRFGDVTGRKLVQILA